MMKAPYLVQCKFLTPTMTLEYLKAAVTGFFFRIQSDGNTGRLDLGAVNKGRFLMIPVIKSRDQSSQIRQKGHQC